MPPGAVARVWVPLAPSNDQQDVTIVEQFLGDAKIGRDKEYGNTMAYFEAKPNKKGEIPFEITFKVRRKEVHTDLAGKLAVPVAAGENVARYLQPDTKVPIAGKPLDLLQASLTSDGLRKDPYAAARTMYDIVRKRLTYKPDGPGVGEGDSLWASDSKHGNCADFHSLFISMARGNKIPAKLEMGFSVPAKPGPVAGYHCWAWFLLNGDGWIPVDISEASRHPQLADFYFGNLDENRVGFSVGRDIILEPRQKGPPLNFFIHPYVEVDGKAYPTEKTQLNFSSKDVP